MKMKCSDVYHGTHVTISIPREAGDNLKYLAKFNTQLLERLGILAVQIDGSETVAVRAKPSEQNARERPPIPSTLSGGNCLNLETVTALPLRSGFKKQVSKSIVSGSRQSCNISAVPYEGRFDKALFSPRMPTKLSIHQASESPQWVVPPSNLVFQSHCFNQHCSVNVSSSPRSFPSVTELGRNHFDFEHPSPGWYLTDKQKITTFPAFQSANIFNPVSSSNNSQNTSNLQSLSSIGNAALETRCTKVPKVRQRKMAKQGSSRNRSVQECTAVGSPFHQITSAAFVKQPSVSREVCDQFDKKGITSYDVSPQSSMKPSCKRYALASTYIDKLADITECLSESELIAKKRFALYGHEEYKLDASVANIPLSASSALKSEPNKVMVNAFSSNFQSSAGQSMQEDGNLSKMKRPLASKSTVGSCNRLSGNIHQTVALQSSTSFHLDEKSGLLFTISPRLQSTAFESGVRVDKLLKRDGMASHCVMEGLNDETVRLSEHDAVNEEKFDSVEFCSNIDNLHADPFSEGQVDLLNEKYRKTCLGFQEKNFERADFLETVSDVPTPNKDSSNEMTVSLEENLTKLQLDDLNTKEKIETGIDSCELTLSDLIGSLSSQESEDTCTGCCIDTGVAVETETVGKESPNLEAEISVALTDDICELNEGHSAGDISPDSAVVGDVTSVETIEENETSSISFLAEGQPLDRCLESSCSEDGKNRSGNIRDGNDSATHVCESNNSSEADGRCESLIEINESDELNAVDFAPVNDIVSSINSNKDISDPVELTWPGLTNEDIEVIKLNNRHSALDLAVTHFEDVSRCSKGTLSEELRRLDALVVCEFNSLVENSSSLFCVAKVTDKPNSKAPRSSIKCVTKKLSGSLKTNRRHFSLHSLLARRRLKRKIIGNIPRLNKDSGHLGRCTLNTSRPVSLAKKFLLGVTTDL